MSFWQRSRGDGVRVGSAPLHVIDAAPTFRDGFVAQAKKRIEENREALSKRSVLDYRPPKIEHTAAIKALQAKLAPLAALETRGGALLSVAEVSNCAEIKFTARSS